MRCASRDIDEQVVPGESSEDYVMRMAREKADRAVTVCSADLRTTVVLGADTVVVQDGDIMGKPRDRFDALAMLARLGDRAHQVLTGAVHRDPG